MRLLTTPKAIISGLRTIDQRLKQVTRERLRLEARRRELLAELGSEALAEYQLPPAEERSQANVAALHVPIEPAQLSQAANVHLP